MVLGLGTDWNSPSFGNNDEFDPMGDSPLIKEKPSVVLRLPKTSGKIFFSMGHLTSFI